MTRRVAPVVDVEELLVAYLVERLGSIVSTEIPESFTAGARRVKVQRVGGAPSSDSPGGVVDRASIQFDAYGTGPGDALELAGDVIEAVRRLEGTVRDGYGIVERIAPTLGLLWSPDPETDASRYLFGFLVEVRPELDSRTWETLVSWALSFDLEDPGVTTSPDPGGTITGTAGATAITLVPNRGSLGSARDLRQDPGFLADGIGYGSPLYPTPELAAADVGLYGDRAFARVRSFLDGKTERSQALTVVNAATAAAAPAAALSLDPPFSIALVGHFGDELDNASASFIFGGAGYYGAAVPPIFSPTIGHASADTLAGYATANEDGYISIELDAIPPTNPATVVDGIRNGIGPHLYLVDVETDAARVYVDGELVVEDDLEHGVGLETTLRDWCPIFTRDSASYADTVAGWTVAGVKTSLFTDAERADLLDFFFDELLPGRVHRWARAGARRTSS